VALSYRARLHKMKWKPPREKWRRGWIASSSRWRTTMATRTVLVLLRSTDVSLRSGLGFANRLT
jgi:hypothetical protein